MRRILPHTVNGAIIISIVVAVAMFLWNRHGMTYETAFLSYVFFIVLVSMVSISHVLVLLLHPTIRNPAQWWKLGFGAPWTYPAKDSQLFDARTRIALVLHDLARKTNDAFNEEREAQIAYQDAIVRRVLDEPSKVNVDAAKQGYMKSRQKAKEVKTRFFAAWDFVKSLGLPELRQALALAPHTFASEKDYRQTLRNYK